MKALKTSICLLIVLTLVAATLVLPASASATGATVEAGKTAYVTFTYSGIYGIDGSFSYTNSSIITNMTVSYSGSMAGAVTTEKAFLYNAYESSVTITFAVTISSSAKAGDKCTISFNYETSDVNGNMSSYNTDTATITVVAPTVDDGGGSTTPTESPTTPIDYEELLRQIGIAEGLSSGDYTADSWANLLAALAEAYSLTDSKSQTDVDAGAQALADAIAALVLMDYSKLLEAIETVNAFIDGDELGTKWTELYQKIIDAVGLLTSGDQDAVDAAAAELLELYLELQDLIQQYIEANRETITVEVEVPVEVEPTGEYCNIPMHRVWPILFIISAILNLGFIILIIVYIVRKKKKESDETPLVNYDIDDDYSGGESDGEIGGESDSEISQVNYPVIDFDFDEDFSSGDTGSETGGDTGSDGNP